MGIDEIENNLKRLVEAFSEESFIYDLLLAYGTPKATVTLLRKSPHKLSGRPDQIIIKKKLFFQEVKNDDPHAVIDNLRKDKGTARHNPRFIVVTDYKILLAVDTKTKDSLDIEIKKLQRHFTFFLPLAGMEKFSSANEAEADIKATEKMARIYDEILKNNKFDKYKMHDLNVFLSRLLFCFFAEDTSIFENNIFTNSISSHTQEDGSDLNSYLDKLFGVLNIPADEKQRESYPPYLQNFPYVNGKLFSDVYPAPKFSKKSRRMIIECGLLDWSAINPDIFGSMFQAVVQHQGSKRGELGIHYTSVPNILKVIKPLFLDDLEEEFSKNYDNAKKLEQLITRLTTLRFFDPACGSGNFLIIAYKEICQLEMKIIERIKKIDDKWQLRFSSISLEQFYGIEIDDFAHEVAILSLWLAKHQMNMKFKETFGESPPTLPLKEGGNIVCDNATRCHWEEVCPQSDDAEIYVFGNPPYLGSKLQSPAQKSELIANTKGMGNSKNLDYISCWFIKAADYISGTKHKVAFVSTNSICQGEQVALLWPHIFKKGIGIGFAYQSFKWSNKAKYNAGVMCIIVGLRAASNEPKVLYADGIGSEVKNINAYLSVGPDVFISRANKPISTLPPICFGNMPNDGGGLILSTEEKNHLIAEHPNAERFIKLLLGSQEYINGQKRWCLWIDDKEVDEANRIPSIAKRIEATRAYRARSNRRATQKLAAVPYRFGEVRYKDGQSIIIPSVSSERRHYIPCGFLDFDVIISNAAHAIYDAEPWVFAIITSAMHMAWVRAVAGRLKTDYRYSAEICYNTFPVPELTAKQKAMLDRQTRNIIGERERHSEKTLAALYDPNKMPKGLRDAHHDLDTAVDRCYSSRLFTSDEERLEYLFRLYEKMTQGQQLFQPEKKKRTRKRKTR